jgi:hypothetical protein
LLALTVALAPLLGRKVDAKRVWTKRPSRVEGARLPWWRSGHWPRGGVIGSLRKGDAICAGELRSPLHVLRRVQFRKQPIGGAEVRGSRCRAPLRVGHGGEVQMRPCLLRPVAVLGKRLQGFLEVYRRFGERPAGSLNASQSALGNPDANLILGFPGAG